MFSSDTINLYEKMVTFTEVKFIQANIESSTFVWIFFTTAYNIHPRQALDREVYKLHSKLILIVIVMGKVFIYGKS